MDVAGTGKVTESALTRELRGAGLRVTRPRLQVLRLLHERQGHHTPEALIRVLRGRGVAISRASVYNVMNDLVASGLVTVADAGPGRAYYEVAETPHHHFVCRECGALFDVPADPAEATPTPRDTAFVAEQVTVVFRGSCPHLRGWPVTAGHPCRHR